MVIYGLFDDSGELRYIGQTIVRLEQRLSSHLKPSSLSRASYKSSWLKSLFDRGVRPEISETLKKKAKQNGN